MKLKLPPETLQALRHQFTKPKKRTKSNKLPGEPREFIPKRSSELRNLTPAQHLAPDGTITSQRNQEVSQKIDPLWEEVRKLRKERNRLLVLATKHCPRDHHDWQELLTYSGEEP